MERESNPMQALCRSGCGFYGSPATDGLCSLCYKEALKKKQQPPAPSPAPSVSNAQSLSSLMETATAQPTIPCLSTTPAASLESTTDAIEEGASAVTNEEPSPTDVDNSDKDGDKDSKKKKNRCAICRKKVGLTDIEGLNLSKEDPNKECNNNLVSHSSTLLLYMKTKTDEWTT